MVVRLVGSPATEKWNKSIWLAEWCQGARKSNPHLFDALVQQVITMASLLQFRLIIPSLLMKYTDTWLHLLPGVLPSISHLSSFHHQSYYQFYTSELFLPTHSWSVLVNQWVGILIVNNIAVPPNTCNFQLYNIIANQQVIITSYRLALIPPQVLTLC